MPQNSLHGLTARDTSLYLNIHYLAGKFLAAGHVDLLPGSLTIEVPSLLPPPV